MSEVDLTIKREVLNSGHLKDHVNNMDHTIRISMDHSNMDYTNIDRIDVDDE